MTAQTTFNVRFRGIRKYKGKRGTTYTVRWTVGGKDCQKTFPTAKLAESHRTGLLAAARAGEPFNARSGLPNSMESATAMITWLDHCIDYIDMKWPDAAPKYRKSLAESLAMITLSLAPGSRGRPDVALLRKALYRWAFNVTARRHEPPDELREAVDWLRAHSPPINDLADPTVVRNVLDAMSRTRDGQQASNATMSRRGAAFRNCLDYAVELRRLADNPLKDIRRKRQPPTPAIDRRRVVNQDQAHALLAAVSEDHPELEAFFAVLYYAGARPGEAINLRQQDLKLPDDGWGVLLFSSSYQRGGSAWTDSGAVGEERQLKHRSTQDTRPVPAHPDLVSTLRRHINDHELGPDGRLFVARTGRAGIPLSPPYDQPVSMKTIYRTWQRARQVALTADESNSPLARRPYDLRHACVSTWLNAGVDPVQVAEWAGHGVAVLLHVYAKCVDGQEAAAIQRIENVLRPSTARD